MDDADKIKSDDDAKTNRSKSFTHASESRSQRSKRSKRSRRDKKHDPFDDKEPYQIDYIKRGKQDYEISELADDEIPITENKNGEPNEVIFADLGTGSYFGQMALQCHDKDKQHLKEVRLGRCFTSVWATQNTHIMYLTDKDYEDFLREQKARKEDEMLKYLRRVPVFKDLRYKQLKGLTQQL